MGDKFFSQMIVELSVGYWAYIGSSSDHTIILPVGCWSWRQLCNCSFRSGLFSILFNIFNNAKNDIHNQRFKIVLKW